MLRDNIDAPLTLAIDIGGSGLKMLVLDPHGQPVTKKTRVNTPQPALPESVLKVFDEQFEGHGRFDRISVGFPGVVVNGVTISAPNLHTDWNGFDLANALKVRTSVPVRVANDADIQGFGVIEGHGVELVVTLGTGFGSALFVEGVLVPNLELGHHPFELGQTYEDLLGQSARSDAGNNEWSERLLRAINQLDALFNPGTIYIGGGNAKKLNVTLPEHVKITPNIAGILGGIKLWDGIVN
ncbi:MAG: ROK family protein [Gammaproteobacteria bacterium]|nr:ROK family protein [Gammaproteobacteria bacterium]